MNEKREVAEKVVNIVDNLFGREMTSEQLELGIEYVEALIDEIDPYTPQQIFDSALSLVDGNDILPDDVYQGYIESVKELTEHLQ